MKERPIIFSGEMVRAILDGRKTQTRRIVKDQYQVDCFLFEDGKLYWDDGNWQKIECPYGRIGDRLWVRETFAYVDYAGRDKGYVYRATDPYMEGFKWKPSIFMPRAASRITLEITNVRVERLQDISEDDAIAEGVFNGSNYFKSYPEAKNYYTFAYGAFCELWQSINGAESWNANDWVFVIEFKVLEVKK